MQQLSMPDAGLAPFQQALTQGWNKALESIQSIGTAGSGDASFKQPRFALSSTSSDKLHTLHHQYVTEATDIWRQGLRASAESAKDRRFAGKAWSDNPISAMAAAVYLLNARTLLGLADAVETDEKSRARLRFGVEQWMA
ncbi:MAG: class I poly(R)-hydroxyalkanoic acid synthase, partial [Variovorax sp.]